MFEHEVHFLIVYFLGGDNEVTLIFTVFIIDYDNEFPFLEVFYRVFYAIEFIFFHLYLNYICC